MIPAWLLDIFAALMLAVAAVSAARLVAARAWRGGAAFADTDIAHLLMAIAMAGMLASSLTTLPDTAWEVIFGLLTAWFAYRVVTDARANGTRALARGHCVPHLAHSAAMLYMLLATAAPAAGGMSGMSGMGGMGGSGAMGGSGMPMLEYPTLALAFTLVLAGYSIWDIDQLSGSRQRAAGTAVLSLAGATVGAAAGPAVPELALVPGAGTDPGSGQAADREEGAGGTADADPADSAAAGDSAGTARALLLNQGMATGCRIVMGVTMAFMLIIMI